MGLYLEQPVTVLHRLDARVKLGWLLAFLIVPILANAPFRLAMAALLVVITLVIQIPLRVWKNQMGWLLTVTFFVCLITVFAPDGYGTSYDPPQPRDELTLTTPPPNITRENLSPPKPGLWDWLPNSNQQGSDPQNSEQQNSEQQNSDSPNSAEETSAILTIKAPETDYKYILFQRGPLRVSRRSFSLALRLSALIFILIYSTTLYLLVTAPEEITAAIDSLMGPLRRFNLPVTEIALTLTLSLRFIPLVLEEVQNLVRSVRTRAINWKKIGLRGTVLIWMTLAERLLENLLMRADQMSTAMKARGFHSPQEHQMLLYAPKLRRPDWLALTSLGIVVVVRLTWGWQKL